MSPYNTELQLQWHVGQGKKEEKKNRIGYIDKNKRLDKSVLHGSCNLCWTLEDVAIQTFKAHLYQIDSDAPAKKGPYHNPKARFF